MDDAERRERNRSESWSRRYRRIIDSYRTALRDIDPVACRHLDARMVEFGEGWVCEGDKPVDVKRLMSAKEIADEFGFQPWNVMDWSRRHPDKVPKHKDGGKTLFRLGDVLAYHAMMGQ